MTAPTAGATTSTPAMETASASSVKASASAGITTAKAPATPAGITAAKASATPAGRCRAAPEATLPTTEALPTCRRRVDMLSSTERLAAKATLASVEAAAARNAMSCIAALPAREVPPVSGIAAACKTPSAYRRTVVEGTTPRPEACRM